MFPELRGGHHGLPGSCRKQRGVVKVVPLRSVSPSLVSRLLSACTFCPVFGWLDDETNGSFYMYK